MSNKVILYVFILMVLMVPDVMLASQERLFTLDAETAAEIDSKIRIQVYPSKILVGNDEAYEVFIDENNELNFRECGVKNACVKLSNRSDDNKCEKMKSDEDGLPERSILLCNKDKEYLMAVYKDDNEDMIYIGGRSKKEKEFKVLRKFEGKAIIPIRDSNFHYGYKSDFFTFAIAKDSAYSPKEGSVLISINKNDGSIVEYLQPFSLKAKPIASGDEVYFVGLDQNVYVISSFVDCNGKENITKLVWENTEGDEVSKIGLYGKFSIIALRHHGEDSVKFFTRDFMCEIYTESGISIFGFVGTFTAPYSSSNYTFSNDIVALVVERDGHLPPRFYLRRWYFEEPKKQFFKVYPVADVKSTQTIGYEKMKVYAEVFEYFNREMVDSDNKIVDLSPEKICRLNNDLPWVAGCVPRHIKSQVKLFKDLASEYSDVEFIKPYSIDVKSSVAGMGLPVNVWPAKGASNEEPKPMIVYVHGGPSLHFDAANLTMYTIMQYLAGQGYWVICPEARGSTGYGDEYEKALVGNWGKEHVDDIIAVAKAFKNRSDIDSSKVFLMGHSFGGYTTLVASTRSDVANYFDGYVSIGGPSEVGKCFKEDSKNDNIDEESHLAYWSEKIGFAAYANHAINAENIEISPFYHIENMRRPVLLIHGGNDTVVLPNQSEEFFYRAKDSKKQVAGIILEGEGHDVGGVYGHAVLPLKFFNEIASEKCLADLYSDAMEVVN